MDQGDLLNRFSFHAAANDQTKRDHEAVRGTCHSLAEYLNGFLPEGREKSLAITNLEQVMFWANAAIARS